MRLADVTTRIALQNVLFATDFSPASESALMFAEAVARRYGSKLFAAHALSPGETPLVPPEYWGWSQQAMDEAARREMEKLAVRLRELPHEVVLRHGGVWEVISELIERFHIDVLIMGTHGREGFEWLLMGSVAEEIFRQAKCPVLTVGPKVIATTLREAEFKEIVFATDFSPESLEAAPYALSLAQEFQARLTFLHVITEHVGPLTNSELLVFDRIKDLRNLIPSDAELWCRPECVVEFGDPAETILRVAQERAADLIVLGVKPGTAHVLAATHLSNATAHTVVSLAGCPVLTVRG